MRWTEFCHFGPFFALLPPPTRKIKILKKGKKQLQMSSFYICVPKMMIIWCMIPEIRSATKITFSPFAPFFAALLLPNNPENQNFEKRKNTSWEKKKKKKNTSWDVINLHMCTKNDDHDAWFLRYGVQQT